MSKRETQSLLVACVLRHGKFEGREYDESWVYALRDLVDEHLSLDHEFVCLSDQRIPGVLTLPLKQEWAGWWSKLELFNLPTAEKVLYLDLDAVPIASLNELVMHDSVMALAPCMIHDKPKKGIIRRYQSSVMSFYPHLVPELYKDFEYERHSKLFRGDQDWIGYRRPDLATFPDQWFVKSVRCPDGPPPGVKVVLHHTTYEAPEWLRKYIGRRV